MAAAGRRRGTEGLTLIGLLASIGIIGLLLTFLAAAGTRVRRSAKVERTRAEAVSLELALEKYRGLTKTLPPPGIENLAPALRSLGLYEFADSRFGPPDKDRLRLENEKGRAEAEIRDLEQEAAALQRRIAEGAAFPSAGGAGQELPAGRPAAVAKALESLDQNAALAKKLRSLHRKQAEIESRRQALSEKIRKVAQGGLPVSSQAAAAAKRAMASLERQTASLARGLAVIQKSLAGVYARPELRQAVSATGLAFAGEAGLRARQAHLAAEYARRVCNDPAPAFDLLLDLQDHGGESPFYHWSQGQLPLDELDRRLAETHKRWRQERGETFPFTPSPDLIARYGCVGPSLIELHNARDPSLKALHEEMRFTGYLLAEYGAGDIKVDNMVGACLGRRLEAEPRLRMGGDYPPLPDEAFASIAREYDAGAPNPPYPVEPPAAAPPAPPPPPPEGQGELSARLAQLRARLEGLEREIRDLHGRRSFLDAWGNPFRYEVRSESGGTLHGVVYSAGPDGEEGTEDDVNGTR